MNKLSSNKKGSFLLMVLVILLRCSQLSAQPGNTCGNAVTISSHDTCRVHEVIQQNEQWYIFIADSTSLRFVLDNELGHDSIVSSIEFYSGICNTLQLIPYTPTVGAEKEGRVTGLTVGNTYFIHLQTASANYAEINWCLWFGMPSIQSSPCQNPGWVCDLICNGNFEYYSHTFYTADLGTANPWNTLTGSADYYNTTGNNLWQVGVPNNWVGTQQPLSGNGYAGFHTYVSWGTNSREYAVSQLNSPLVVGQKYKVSFWVSRADLSSHATRNIGAYLSAAQPIQNNNLGPLAVTPQVLEPSLITNSSSWFQVKGTVTGNGEQYITIGHFLPDGGQHQFISNTSYLDGDMAYYYLDDVSIIPIDSLFLTSNPSNACANTPFTLSAYTTTTPGPVTYTWYPANLLVSNSGANVTTISLTPGTYTFQCVMTASDHPGCPIGEFITVTVSDYAVANAGADQSICKGSSAILTGVPSGVFTGYGWSVLGGQQLCSGCTSYTVTPTQTTSYVFTAYNGHSGCSIPDTVTIFVHPNPIANITGALYNDCSGGMQTYTPLNTQPNVIYSWFVSGDSSNVVGNNSIDINWSVNGGFVIMTAIDTTSDCQSSDTLFVTPCCTGQTSVIFNNRSAKSVLSDPNFAAYVNGTDFNYNNSIIINGQFNVDTTFTFSNCSVIDMGGNAQIVVQPTRTLTFDQSTISVKCAIMWDGIFIQGNTAHLNIINNSKLQQARNAIVSVNGGDFFVENSILDNNYKDIVVEDYAFVHTANVRTTVFSMTGTFLTAVPPLPLGHTKTVCGVEIKNNAGITIGDAAMSGYQNNFTNILVGVRSRNSITTVTNCKFQNFTPTVQQSLTIPDAGTGVMSYGQKGVNYHPTINVGGATVQQRCVFLNMPYAVHTKAAQHINIANNNITQIKRYPVWIESDRSSTVSVTDNFISNQSVNYGMTVGIWVKDLPFCNVSIARNTVIQTANTAAQNGTGIRVEQVSAGSTVVNIHSNPVVSRFRTGIHVMNLAGIGNTKIDSNSVSFTKPNANYTGAHYGIRIAGCHDVVCDDNTVQKTGANPTSTMAQNLRGVSIENSVNTIASDNILIRMGSGLFGYEISSSSTLACNTMNSCYYGVYFGGGANTLGFCDIGDQIVDPNGTPAATGNTWITTISPFDGFGGVTQAYDWRYIGQMPSFAVNNMTPQPLNYNACSFFFLQPSHVGERDKLVGYALRTAADSNTTNEVRYTLYSNAYAYLTATPAWLSLGTPDDTLYQNFFANFDATNIGFITDLIAAADTGNVQFVSSGANGMTTTNNIEDNIKKVFSVYAASWMVDVDSFSPVDSLQLYDIATQDPAGGGAGVYGARVLLGLDVDDYGVEDARISATETEQVQQPILFAVYPVPTSGNLTLEFGIDEGQHAELQIFDLTGKLVLVQTLQPLGNVYSIETQPLSEGVYMLRVVVDGRLSETKRMVIIK